MPSQGVPADLKEALIGLASVAVVVWTGCLVLRQIKSTPSSWTLVAAMDLLQASFVVSILAIGIPSNAYRAVGLAFIALYTVAYWYYFACFISPRFLASQSPAFQATFKAKKNGSIWIAATVLFFAGSIIIIAWPCREMVFVVAFIWFFLGSQVLYTSIHGA